MSEEQTSAAEQRTSADHAEAREYIRRYGVELLWHRLHGNGMRPDLPAGMNVGVLLALSDLVTEVDELRQQVGTLRGDASDLRQSEQAAQKQMVIEHEQYTAGYVALRESLPNGLGSDTLAEGVIRLRERAEACRKTAAEANQLAAVKTALESDDLVERMAAFAHRQWSGWASWMLDKWGERHDSGETFQERWRRQMATDYADLSEQERDSDRTETHGMLNVVRAALAEAEAPPAAKGGASGSD